MNNRIANAGSFLVFRLAAALAIMYVVAKFPFKPLVIVYMGF